MATTADRLLWVLENDLRDIRDFELTFAKGCTVYLLSRRWVSEFRRRALRGEDLDFSNCALDNSDLLDGRVTKKDAVQRAVVVSEATFMHMFRSLVASPDQIVKGWVFWSPSLQAEVITKSIPLRYVLIASGHCASGVLDLSENESLEDTIADVKIQHSQHKNWRYRYWSSKSLSDIETIRQKVENGETLESFAEELIVDCFHLPLLQVLTTLTLIVEQRPQNEFIQELTTVFFSPRNESVGLSNLGNTCFLNSVLQGLAHIPEMALHFSRLPVQKDKPLLQSFRSLIVDMFGQASGTVLKPTDVRSALCKHMQQYDDFEQKDAEELLMNLLQCLVDEDKVNVSELIPQMEFLAQDSAAWIRYLAENYSFVASLFAGMMQDTITCRNCEKQRVQFNPCMSLPLFLVPPRVFTICLADFNPRIMLRKFAVEVKSPLESEIEIDAIHATLVQELRHNHFYLGEMRDGEFVGPIDGRQPATSAVYWALMLPSEPGSKAQVLFNITAMDERGYTQRFGCRVMACSPRAYAHRLPSLIVEFLRLAGNAYFAELGFFARMTFKQVSDRAAKKMEEHCLLRVLLPRPGSEDCEKMSLSQAQERFQVETVEELLNLDPAGAVRLDFIFPELPKVISAALTEFSSVTSIDTDEQSIVVTLPQLLEFNLAEKAMGEKLMCEVCGEATQHKHRQQVVRFPRVAVFSILRIRVQGNYMRKSRMEVCFPESGLDLSSFQTGPDYSPANYYLTSLIRHQGQSVMHGHYKAFARSPVSGKWFRYDDSKTERVTRQQVLDEGEAYMLIYVRQ